MTYTEVVAKLQGLGLKEVGAQQWACTLTRDGAAPSEQEVEDFVERRLKPALRAIRERAARVPQVLTTPEERFGGAPGPNEPTE